MENVTFGQVFVGKQEETRMSNKNITFTVHGMTCSHCESTIKNAVNSVNGVVDVSVHLDTKKVAVEFEDEKVDEQTIKDTVADQGYEVG